MSDISEETHVDKADAWDRNARKNSAIAELRDRAESAEAVLRVVLEMLKDEAHTREDIEGYLESSMAIINSTNGEQS